MISLFVLVADVFLSLKCLQQEKQYEDCIGFHEISFKEMGCVTRGRKIKQFLWMCLQKMSHLKAYKVAWKIKTTFSYFSLEIFHFEHEKVQIFFWFCNT